MEQDKSLVRILIVDDEQDILEFLDYNLKKEGYQVFRAHNGQEAVEQVQLIQPHLILMDVMMPIVDGIEACYQIRKQEHNGHPIIALLTSRGEDYSQVAGFEAGADDYITKPIRPRLLMSRIEALLRRLNFNQSAEQVIPDSIRINREKFQVLLHGNPIYLPKKEFELLEFLMSKPGRVFNRDEIMMRIWGKDIVVGERTIDVHIRKLREKLGDDYIRTIKGVGYTFNSIETA